MPLQLVQHSQSWGDVPKDNSATSWLFYIPQGRAHTLTSIPCPRYRFYQLPLRESSLLALRGQLVLAHHTLFLVSFSTLSFYYRSYNQYSYIGATPTALIIYLGSKFYIASAMDLYLRECYPTVVSRPIILTFGITSQRYVYIQHRSSRPSSIRQIWACWSNRLSDGRHIKSSVRRQRPVWATTPVVTRTAFQVELD